MALTESAALVLLAAGQGSRAGGDIPKQFAVHRSGLPLITMAIQRALAAGAWAQIIVTAPPDGVDRMARVLAESAIPAATVVAGGTARVDSMIAAVAAVDDRISPICVVHDGTRPLTPPRLFSAVLAELASGRVDAAWPGGRPSNSVFDTSGDVPCLLPPRQLQWAATPIAARTDAVRQVLSGAREKERALAAQLIESGVTWATVPDSPLNFKVTTPEDLDLALRMDVTLTPST